MSVAVEDVMAVLRCSTPKFSMTGFNRKARSHWNGTMRDRVVGS